MARFECKDFWARRTAAASLTSCVWRTFLMVSPAESSYGLIWRKPYAWNVFISIAFMNESTWLLFPHVIILQDIFQSCLSKHFFEAIENIHKLKYSNQTCCIFHGCNISFVHIWYSHCVVLTCSVCITEEKTSLLLYYCSSWSLLFHFISLYF